MVGEGHTGVQKPAELWKCRSRLEQRKKGKQNNRRRGFREMMLKEWGQKLKKRYMVKIKRRMWEDKTRGFLVFLSPSVYPGVWSVLAYLQESWEMTEECSEENLVCWKTVWYGRFIQCSVRKEETVALEDTEALVRKEKKTGRVSRQIPSSWRCSRWEIVGQRSECTTYPRCSGMTRDWLNMYGARTREKRRPVVIWNSFSVEEGKWCGIDEEGAIVETLSKSNHRFLVPLPWESRRRRHEDL